MEARAATIVDITRAHAHQATQVCHPASSYFMF